MLIMASIILASLATVCSLLPSSLLTKQIMSITDNYNSPQIILYANAQSTNEHTRSNKLAIRGHSESQSSLMTLSAKRSKRFSDYEQSFEVQPDATYYPHLGLDLRIRCIIRRRQGECSWLRNGRVVGQLRNKYEYLRTPDDGDCSLLIRNVSMASEDGTWQCQVTAQDIDHEPLISRELQVVVLVTPEKPIIKNTVSQSIDLYNHLHDQSISFYIILASVCPSNECRTNHQLKPINRRQLIMHVLSSRVGWCWSSIDDIVLETGVAFGHFDLAP